MARPRGNRWQGDVEYQGERKRKSFATREEAELWEKEVELANLRGLPMPGTVTNRGTISGTFGDFVGEHFNFLWGDKKSPESPRLILSGIEKILGDDFQMKDFDYQTMSKLVNHFQEKGNTGATINRKVDTLMKLLKHAKKLKVISEIPEAPRFRETKGRMRFFDKSEEALIVSRFEHFGLIQEMHLTHFLLYTGARVGEALAIEKRDVDRNRKIVSLWETKADEPRSVPITKPVEEAAKWCERNIDGKNLFDIDYYAYRRSWDRVRDALGATEDPGWVIHTLRHTTASRLVQAGVDLRRVQVWMGHKSIKTTLRYAHLAPTDLEVAAKALVA